MHENEFDPDLLPLYQLQESDYIRIVNGMTTLLIRTIRSLRHLGNEALAQEIAQKGSCILADYGPDVEELVRLAGMENDGLRSVGC